MAGLESCLGDSRHYWWRQGKRDVGESVWARVLKGTDLRVFCGDKVGYKC